jgi:hypothetical protein
MAISETARLIASLELKDLFTKQVANAEKSLGGLDKKLDQTQSRSYRAGQQIGHGIQNATRIIAAAAISAATISAGVFALAIKKASDLSETVNKVGVVFKNQTPLVLAFGKDAASSMGLTEQAALEAAATFGNLFTAMKLPVAKSAEMSDKLVQLASDLASFNNIDPAVALEKLQSGITGQFRPLKELGVNIDQASIKQEAFRLGLIKTTKTALTPAIKAQAAYSLIFQQTKTAQGDFARTSGGLANQVRILKANFDDLLASLGTAALPGVAKIFVRINAAIKENAPAIAKLGDAIAGLFSDANINQGAAFIENALKTAMAAAPILVEAGKATLFFIQQAVGIFNSLPDPLKAIVVGGFALNKLTGGLVTNVAGGLVDLIGKTRGASPANPVFVSDISKGLPGVGGPGGIAGGLFGDIIAGGALPVILTVGTIAALGIALSDAMGRKPDLVPVSEGGTPGQVFSRGHGFGRPGQGTPSPGGGLPNPILDRGGREAGGFSKDLTGALAHILNAFGKQDAGFKFVLGALHQDFRNALKELSGAKTASEIKKAIVDANKIIFTKGIGGSGGAAATEKTLKGLLTKFPQLASILVPEIRKIHAKVLGRQFEEAEFRKFDRINKSNLDNGKKVAELQKIAKDVGAKDRANGARLQAKVDALKSSLTHAIGQDIQAIKDKDLSVRVTIPVSNRVVVNARTVQAQAAVFTRVFGGSQTAKNPGGGIGF